MLALSFDELPQLSKMLKHIEDNSAAFGGILMFLARTGIPDDAIDQFQVILMDLVAERFGLKDSQGSYAGFREALKDTEQECLVESEFDAVRNMQTLLQLVDRFLANVPR